MFGNSAAHWEASRYSLSPFGEFKRKHHNTYRLSISVDGHPLLGIPFATFFTLSTCQSKDPKRTALPVSECEVAGLASVSDVESLCVEAHVPEEVTEEAKAYVSGDMSETYSSTWSMDEGRC